MEPTEFTTREARLRAEYQEQQLELVEPELLSPFQYDMFDYVLASGGVPGLSQIKANSGTQSPSKK